MFKGILGSGGAKALITDAFSRAKESAATSASARVEETGETGDAVPEAQDDSVAVTAAYTAEDVSAGFLRFDSGWLIGWIACANPKEQSPLPVLHVEHDDDTEPYPVIDFPVVGTSDGEAPVAGARRFMCDLSNAVAGRNLNDLVSLSLYEDLPRDEDAVAVKGRLLLREEVPYREEIALNENPLLIPSGTSSIDGWEVDHDERIGLRLDRFTLQNLEIFDESSRENAKSSRSPRDLLPAALLSRPAKYTRFALTKKNHKDSSLVLSCPVIPTRFSDAAELEMLLCVRADRPIWMNCRLIRDRQTIATAELFVDSSWTDSRQTLKGSHAKPLFVTAKYRFEIEIRHAGRGHLDFAACAIGSSPSMYGLCSNEVAGTGSRSRPRRSPDGTAGSKNYIRNGDFEKWSNGIDFRNLIPRQEVADGWRFECRKNQLSKVGLQFHNVVKAASGLAESEKPSYGLRVTTRDFVGPMRVVSLINQEMLDCDDMRLSMEMTVPESEARVQCLRRVYLIGRSEGTDEILHVIARKPRVRGHAHLEYPIDEGSLVKLRTAAALHASLLLVIEFEENSSIVISSVQLCEARPDSSRASSRAAGDRDARIGAFEDASISEQIPHVKGLETWMEGISEVVAGNALEAAGSADGSTGDPRAAMPTWERPSRGFPSMDIVVPVFNALEVVSNCLDSVIRETGVPYNVICVDDASGAETAEWLDDFTSAWPHVRLIRNESNLGYTRSVNRGLAASNADWVCVLNSDCLVTASWLERLADVAMACPRAGIVGPLSNAASYQSVPKIRTENGSWCFNPLPPSTTPNDMARLVWENSLSKHPRTEVANGFCQLIRREMLDSIGLLDEAAFPRGFGEENDLCARAIKAGWEIRIADDTYVYHVKSQSFGHEERKKLSKIGSTALKAKHPDIDWGLVTGNLEREGSLVELRKRIIAAGYS